MKPNDKAYKAARKVAYNRINKCFVFDLIKEAVDAAHAAQFQSEDYAELIETLRSSSPYTLSHVAADALEALLAERDALKAKNESMRQSLPLWAHKQMAANSALIDCLRANLAAVTEERDRMREALKDCEKEMRSFVSYIRIAPNTKWDRDSGILLEILRKADAARAALEGVTEKSGAGNE